MEVCWIEIGMGRKSISSERMLYLDECVVSLSKCGKKYIAITGMDDLAKCMQMARVYTASIFASLYAISESIWQMNDNGRHSSMLPSCSDRKQQAESDTETETYCTYNPQCKVSIEKDGMDLPHGCEKIHDFRHKLNQLNETKSEWEPVVSNSSGTLMYKSWKKFKDGGPYMEYLSSSILFDANPVDVAMFIMDFRSRSKMDGNTLDYMFVDARSVEGKQILADETLCVVTKFPVPLAARRYVYDRTSYAVGDEFFVVSSTTEVPLETRAKLPWTGNRVVDVEEFESVVCIRQVETDGRNAVEVVMNYFENPKLPPALCNFAAQASQWRLAIEFHQNFKHYSSICEDSNLSTVLKEHAASKKLVDLCVDGSVEKLVQDVNDLVEETSEDKLKRERRRKPYIRALVAIVVVVLKVHN